MSHDQEEKNERVEEVDTADEKWQSRHVEESQIPIEQRKAEARLMQVTSPAVSKQYLTSSPAAR